MVEVKDGLVYVTVDEPDTLQKIVRLRRPAATYFDPKGRPFAWHWLLTNEEVGNLQITPK